MLAALLVPSKVLSVQYIVWFLPLVPLLADRWRWLVVTISALSTLVYPFLDASLWELDPTTAAVLNVRNLLLVVLLAGMTASLARTSSPGAFARPASAA